MCFFRVDISYYDRRVLRGRGGAICWGRKWWSGGKLAESSGISIYMRGRKTVATLSDEIITRGAVEYRWPSTREIITDVKYKLFAAVFLYIYLRAQYTVYTYTYPARKKTRQNGLCYFYDIREIRVVLINIYIYIYILYNYLKNCSAFSEGGPKRLCAHTHPHALAYAAREAKRIYTVFVSICMCLLFLSTSGNITHKLRFTWNSDL